MFHRESQFFDRGAGKIHRVVRIFDVFGMIFDRGNKIFRRNARFSQKTDIQTSVRHKSEQHESSGTDSANPVTPDLI